MAAVDDIFATVAAIAPEIRDGLAGRRVQADTGTNPSGEQRLAADLYADELLAERLLALDPVASYASEERPDVRESEAGGTYHLAVDPLDGSSNLKPNNTMGTIVGVYDAPLPARGADLVAAGYVLYGPITTMVSATDETVSEAVIDATGTREIVAADVTLPADPVVYGVGGRVPEWPDAFTAYVREIETELKLRYGGAMIGDVNQVLTYGGVFAYPGLRDRPEGKLRLQFEGAPIGYILEAAGGRSSDGSRSLLAVEPTELHQRVPVHVGNAALIDRLEAALA